MKLLPTIWRKIFVVSLKMCNFAVDMKQKLLLILAIVSIGGLCHAQAQTDSINNVQTQRKVEFHLGTDFVTSYIWRGLKQGSVSLQPEMSVSWKGLSLTAWGNVGLSNKDDPSEIDLTLSYETSGLSFGIVDYWDDANNTRYFYYKKDHTGHAFEGFVKYDFGPVCASWQTIFAGRDYSEGDGKREYSSYIEVSAPFTFTSCDWDATVGVVPWKTDYYETNGFCVTNLSLRATKAVEITKKFALPLFGELTANPASQKMYFVFGFN